MESINTFDGTKNQSQSYPTEISVDAQLKKTIEELRNLEKKNLRINRLKLLLLIGALLLCIAAAYLIYVNISSTVQKIDEMSVQLTEAGKSINAVAKELETFDFEKLNTSLQNIIVTSEETVTQVHETSKGLANLLKNADDAVTHINSIDFEDLNNGIRKLNDILEPVAKFFGSMN